MEKLIVKWAFLLCFISVSMNITMAQTQEKSPVKAPQAQSNPGRIAAEPSQVICDALLLDNTKANEIKKLYNEAREEVIAKMKKEPNSSPDKINTAMGKSYSEIAVLFKQKITGKLPDNAIQAIEPILAHRSITTIAELRALRFVQLQETQQAEIQPYSINLVLAGIPGATMKPEEVQEKVQEEKTKYLEKVTSILTPEQKTAWDAKTELIKNDAGIRSTNTKDSKEVKNTKVKPEQVNATSKVSQNKEKTTKSKSSNTKNRSKKTKKSH